MANDVNLKSKATLQSINDKVFNPNGDKSLYQLICEYRQSVKITSLKTVSAPKVNTGL
jgi:hypothetical protein